MVHSVPPFFFRNALRAESRIETLGSGHLLRVKVAGFDEFVFDNALGVVGLDGKGAGGKFLASLAILRLPPVDDNLVVDAGLDVPSGHPNAQLDPVSVDMGGHVVVHNAVERASLDAVSVGGVDLALVANIGPASFLKFGVEEDTTVCTGLGTHHGFKFKVVPFSILTVFPRPEEVSAFAVDHQGFVFHGEGFGVFGGAPAVQ